LNHSILYGVPVQADLEFFEHAGALRPAALDAAPVTLTRSASPLSLSPEQLPLYQTHGRVINLYSDRLMGPSQLGQPWQFVVADVLILSWVGGSADVQYQLLEHGTQELLVFWFAHIFMPIYLTLERSFDFIHAAAVELGNRPVMFIAPSTGGKSTLGDYFLKQGHPMLSDDKVATFLQTGRFWAAPSHPHHRPFRAVEVLGYPIENFASQPRPIHAFYVLEAGEPDDLVEITEVLGFRKFEELLPNYLFSFDFLQRKRMKWLAELADTSRVFRVKRPWNLERQHETYDAICHHSGSIANCGQ
jgi:hypothetical protein